MKKNPNVNKYNEGLPGVKKLKAEDDCFWMPNAKIDYLQMPKKRRKHLETQTKRYGFNECETWELDYTACVWLYSHIKMMLDIGGKIVNYSWEWWGDEFRKELQDVGVDTDKYHNDKMVFEYICEMLEEADKLQDAEIDSSMDLDSWLKRDKAVLDLRQKAFKVFAVMMPRAGW